LYRIPEWGEGHYAVNSHGDLLVTLESSDGARSTVSLRALIDELQEDGHFTPATFFFPDILERRVEELDAAIDYACQAHGCPDSYRLAFPIKVNQRLDFLQAIGAAKTKHPVDYEVSGIPELDRARGLCADSSGPDRRIICHGSKGRNYVRKAIEFAADGQKIVLVIEAPWEAHSLIGEIADHGLPEQLKLGLRVRPAPGDSVDRHFQSKFGLTPASLLETLQSLQKAKLTSSVTMLHFHRGKDITDPEELRPELQEVGRIYQELRTMGLPIDELNIGGGLSTSRPVRPSDDNPETPAREQRWQEYADVIIGQISNDLQGSEHSIPRIITENGKALVAQSEFLVSEVLGVSRRAQQTNFRALAKSPQPLRDLSELIGEAKVAIIPEECIEEAVLHRARARTMFRDGRLSLADLATADSLFAAVMAELAPKASSIDIQGRSQGDLGRFCADIYHINASIFQSVPDAWAVDLRFPVLPIENLDQCPDRCAVISDISCDEDGVLERFIDPYDDVLGIPLHSLKRRQTYYVGIGLVGAYQEALSNSHNLFNKTTQAVVRLKGNTPNIDEVRPVANTGNTPNNPYPTNLS